MSNLQVIPKGTKGATVYKSVLDTLDPESIPTTVLCDHKTNHKSLKDGEGFKCQWLIDFGNCSQAEVLEMASKTVVIGFRPQFKTDSDPDSFEYGAGYKVDAAKWFRSQRETMGDAGKVAKLLGISVEAALQVIATVETQKETVTDSKSE